MTIVSCLRRLGPRFALFGALALAPSRLPAASSSSDATILHRAKEGYISVEHNGRTEWYKKGSTIPLPVRGEKEINLILGDPNTLVFRYELGKLTEKETEDFAALKKFGEDVLKKVFTFGASGGQYSIRGVTIDVNPAIAKVHELAALKDKIPALVLKSLSQNLTTTDFDPATYDVAIREVAVLHDFFTQVSRAMLTPNDLTIAVPPSTTTTLSTTDLWNANSELRSIFDASAELQKVIDASKTFVADFRAYLKALNQPYFLGSVTASNRLIKTQPVSIGGLATRADDPIVKADQEAYSGDYKFDVSVYSTFHYRISAGVIYSFVKNPDYSLATGATGMLTIAQKTNDYNELTGAVALNIYPDKFFHEGVKWFGQIGASPTKDAKALLAGVGFNAFDKMTVAAGIAYQQRRVLGGGQSVGMTLAKAEDLKVDLKYASGLYVLVGVDF